MNDSLKKWEISHWMTKSSLPPQKRILFFLRMGSIKTLPLCSFFFLLNVKFTSKVKKYDELKCHYEEVCGAHTNHHFVSALLTSPQN